MTHIPTASYPVCRFCTEHIELETASTDEKGRAVHEDCYVAYILAKSRIYESASRGLLLMRARDTPENSQAVARPGTP